VCWCLAFVIDKPLTPKPKVLGPQPFLISGFSNNVVFLFLYSTFVIAETPINLFFFTFGIRATNLSCRASCQLLISVQTIPVGAQFHFPIFLREGLFNFCQFL
jgi:hypothetical protein